MPAKNTRRHTATRLLLIMPWHVSLLLGEAIFVACKWIVPAFFSSDAALKPELLAWSNMAEILASLFLLLGAVIFATQKKKWLAGHFHAATRTRIATHRSPAPWN